jgi:histidyl-tRNA synthetase
MATRSFKGPRGTRDMYPEDMLRRRYLLHTWRDTSIRHGFEEIEGPTFEEAELYAVKSGEGILGELFQAFSGKSPEEVEQVKSTGRAPFAMRPEFTPTLARMYAARAANLPKPTRWFMAGPFFRAERPQRGRLREFLQWNCDVLGSPDEKDDDGRQRSVESDFGCLCTCIDALVGFGLGQDPVGNRPPTRIRLSDRQLVASALLAYGVEAASIPAVLMVFDKAESYSVEAKRQALVSAGVDEDHVIDVETIPSYQGSFDLPLTSLLRSLSNTTTLSPNTGAYRITELKWLHRLLGEVDLSKFVDLDLRIVRGLAYYTGTVFEVIAQGERAVAGGGRYDNLIELLGGPPTPAVGFAMGDVVLSLLLEDKGLMPEGPELMDALSRRPASLRPEAFVIGANDEASDAPVRRLVADLRRGVESPAYLEREGRKPWHADRYTPAPSEQAPGGVRPMHARASDKSTRNLKKLLNDAERQFARFAVILHGDGTDPGRVQIKDMDARKDLTPADIPGLPSDIAEFSADPASPVYAGRAIVAARDFPRT